MRFTQALATAIVAALPVAYAQTFTSCNPMEKTCPKDVALNSATFKSDFATGSEAEASWSKAAYTTINYDSQGAQFRIAKQGQAPTIETNFYFFFGRVDVTMKPAPGQGIVSSIVLESDDLDEVDWEFLGGFDNKVQTNFFGKGNTTSYDRMIEYNVATPQETWHTYSLDWTAERLQWIIDGTLVRELKYADPVALGGKTYPQTPMQLKLGSWAAGGEGVPEGTVEWAGGKTDFSQGPFDMYVKEVSITNYNTADSYEYGDKSGSWQSIKINKDGSSSSASGSGSATTSSESESATTSVVASNTTVPETSSAAVDTQTAYTSQASVQPLDQHTEAANSVTLTGSMYSTNTASASALNSAINASTMETAISVTTQVPDSTPTGSPIGYGNATETSNTTTPQGPSTSTHSPAEQTANAGSSLKGSVVAGSVVGLALGVFML